MNRNQIFETYHNLSQNPTNDNREIRNMYFLVISLNGWMPEYCGKYSDEYAEFGL